MKTLLILNLAISTACATLGHPPPSDDDVAVELVRDYVRDIQRGRFVRAYWRTSERYRAGTGESNFATTARDIVYLREATGFQPRIVTPVADGYRVEGLLVSGGEVPCTAFIVREPKGLRLDRLEAPAEPLMPRPRGPALPVHLADDRCKHGSHVSTAAACMSGRARACSSERCRKFGSLSAARAVVSGHSVPR